VGVRPLTDYIENLYIFNYKLYVWLINLKRVKNGVWV
jgi:hypothetical protein